MKKKELTVRKKRIHRQAMWFFTLVFGAVPVGLYLAIPQPLFALAGCVPFLCFLPVLAIYETWQLRFGEKGIEKSLCGIKHFYPYTLIRSAAKAYYTSEKATVIRVRFTDGTAIRFRTDDENGNQAEKELQRHCSITT